MEVKTKKHGKNINTDLFPWQQVDEHTFTCKLPNYTLTIAKMQHMNIYVIECLYKGISIITHQFTHQASFYRGIGFLEGTVTGHQMAKRLSELKDRQG